MVFLSVRILERKRKVRKDPWEKDIICCSWVSCNHLLKILQNFKIILNICLWYQIDFGKVLHTVLKHCIQNILCLIFRCCQVKIWAISINPDHLVHQQRLDRSFCCLLKEYLDSVEYVSRQQRYWSDYTCVGWSEPSLSTFFISFHDMPQILFMT